MIHKRIENRSLILGSSRGIGLALVEQLLLKNSGTMVSAVHREKSNIQALMALQKKFPKRLELFVLDIKKESSYIELCQNLKNRNHIPSLVLNCIGILHDDTNSPERSLSEISPQFFLSSMEVNILPTLLLAKHMGPLIEKEHRFVFASLSAKVGSLQDNRLGGWYSYRSSKAALNMVLKNLSIEWKRLSKNITVLALHPGTTETELSKSFLQNAKKYYKIHKPSETAINLLKVIDAKGFAANSGQFYSWDGSEIDW